MIGKITAITILSLACVAITLAAHAQTDVPQQKITWTSSESVDLQTGNTYHKTLKFETDGDRSIDIPNRLLTNIEVTRVDGTWTDVALPGKLVYYVLLNGTEATVTIEKNDTGTYITIETVLSSPDGIHRKFTISATKLK